MPRRGHGLLKKASHLLGLLLGALDDQLVVAGDYESGAEVVEEPFAEETHSHHETSAPIPGTEWLAFSFTSRRACCRR
jgi:hypothetical protein